MPAEPSAPAPAAALPLRRRLRLQLYAILHAPHPRDLIARLANYFLAALIVTNAAAVAVQSLPGLSPGTRAALYAFEALSTALYLVEYLGRLWTCVEQPLLARPVLGRLRWMVQPLALLDLLAIVTFWTPWDMRFLRVVRLVRLLKILHLYEFEAALERLWVSLARRKELLLVSVALMAMFVYLASSLLYQIEHERQPEVFSSVPATFWWACVTFNTIGYGDMVPLTPLGRLFAALASIFGVGIFALPTAIVIAAIIESSAAGTPYVCDVCGHRGVTSDEPHPPQR